MIMMLMFLCMFVLLLVLIIALQKLWWTPIRIQKVMSLRGIKGPPYRFMYGNGKEIINMQKEAMLMPVSLSHDISPRLHPHIHSWTKKYGKNFLMWYGVQPVFVVTEPELCKEILNNKGGAFPKTKQTGLVNKLFGDSLAMTEGEKWGKLRKLANHAFKGESLKAMWPDMTASAKAMVERWKNYEGKEIEVSEEFRLLTSEVIARTAFGSSYTDGENIFEMLRKLSIIVFRNLYKTRFPGMSKVYRTSDEIEADKLEKEIQDSVLDIVKNRENARSKGGESSGDDFLGLLLKARYERSDEQKLSIENVVEECKALYFVGQETTSTLLSWTVLLLAQHPDWQEEARNEVLQLFGKETPNYDGISKLKTMSMIINETLRLYPPANQIGRIVPREVKLGSVLVPANVELLIPTVALHHDPDIWGKDAARFKPERFSQGVAQATNDNTGSYIPFGMGPRMCAGINLASNEAKIALSMILQHYSFTLSPGYVHSPYQFLTVRPRHGVQVMLHSLSHAQFSVSMLDILVFSM